MNTDSKIQLKRHALDLLKQYYVVRNWSKGKILRKIKEEVEFLSKPDIKAQRERLERHAQESPIKLNERDRQLVLTALTDYMSKNNIPLATFREYMSLRDRINIQ